MIAQVPSSEWQQENHRYLIQHLNRLQFVLQTAAGEGEGVEGVEGVEGGEFSSTSSSSSHTPHTPHTPHTSDTSHAPHTPAIETICQSLGLSPFERDILLLCAGVELDASFASLIADIQGDPQHDYPTFSLALAVLESAYWGALTPDAPLRKWRLFTESKNMETVIQQLVQIYLVDETPLRHDVTKFVEELVEEELLNRENKIDESNLVAVDKIKELLQPQVPDNRLPYEAPLLRKHGKVNVRTNTTPFFGDFEFANGLFDFTDFS